jgi:hypothetical protein
MSKTAVAMVAALALGGLVACDPPNTPTLTVTSTATGADAEPGDGVCEASAGGGDCTLPAAVDEANALGRAAISVPAGAYEGMDLTVTGNVRLNWGAPADVVLGDVDITVADGGALRAEGLRSRVTDPPPEGSTQPGTHPVTLSVASSLYSLFCTPTATDVYGAPWGVDGNGDGADGCDVGAAELQP